MNHAMRVFEMSNAEGRWIDDEEKRGMDYSNRKCQSSLLGSAGFGSPKVGKYDSHLLSRLNQLLVLIRLVRNHDQHFQDASVLTTGSNQLGAGCVVTGRVRRWYATKDPMGIIATH